MNSLLLLTVWLPLVLPTAYFVFAFTYRMNGGTDSITRELRRTIWCVWPGAVGRRSRISVARKEIRALARVERTANLHSHRLSFFKDGVERSYCKIAAQADYEPYVAEFVHSSKWTLIEPLLIGIGWPLLLVFIAINNLTCAAIQLAAAIVRFVQQRIIQNHP